MGPVISGPVEVLEVSRFCGESRGKFDLAHVYFGRDAAGCVAVATNLYALAVARWEPSPDDAPAGTNFLVGAPAVVLARRVAADRKARVRPTRLEVSAGAVAVAGAGVSFSAAAGPTGQFVPTGVWGAYATGGEPVEPGHGAPVAPVVALVGDLMRACARDADQVQCLPELRRFAVPGLKVPTVAWTHRVELAGYEAQRGLSFRVLVMPLGVDERSPFKRQPAEAAPC